MGDRSPDIFDTEEEGGRNEEYEEKEEDKEENSEEEQEEGEEKSSSSQDENWTTMNQTMIRGVLYVRKWVKISKNPT